MPISLEEKKKLSKHSFDEVNRKGEDFIYLSQVMFSPAVAIKSGWSSFIKKPQLIFLNLPQGLMLSFILYLIYTSTTNSSDLFTKFIAAALFFTMIILFFMFEILVSSQIASYYKNNLVGYHKAKFLRTAIASLSIMQPVGYMLFFTVILLINYSLVLSVMLGIIGVLLYIGSINQSLLPYALSIENGKNRSSAINWGWASISNLNLQTLLVNLIIFLPFIILVILYLSLGSILLLVLLILVFIISDAIWYGATSYIYKAVSKSKNVIGFY